MIFFLHLVSRIMYSLLEWELFLNFVKKQKNEIEKSIHLIDYPFKIREYSDKIFLKFNT